MSALRRLAALLGLLLLLVGLPAGLLAFGDVSPLLVDPRELLTMRDDGRVLLALLTVVGWLAWGVMALSTAVEAVGMVRGRRLRLPGLSAPQALAGALLSAIFATGVVGSPAMAAPPPPAPVAVAPLTSTVAPATVAAAEATTTAPAHGTYVVQAGDDLWTIAETLFGDGLLWHELWHANQGRVPDPHHIEAGWRLVLPDLPRVDGDASTAPAPASAMPADPSPSQNVPAEAAPGESTPAPVETSSASRAPASESSPAPAPSMPESPSSAEADTAPSEPLPTQEHSADEAPLPGAEPPEAQPDAPSPTIPAAPAPAPRPEASSTIPAPAPETESAPATTAGAPTATPERLGPDSPLQVGVVAAGLGSLAAAAVLGVVGLRRQQRAGGRRVGTRFVDAPRGASRLEAVLAASARAISMADLDLVRRVVTEHAREHGLPHLARALVADDRIELVLTTEAAQAPVGFVAEGATWRVPLGAIDLLRADDDTPPAWPALLPVGETDDGCVLVDLAEAGHLAVGSVETRRALLSALLTRDQIDVWCLTDDPLVAAFGAPGARVVTAEEAGAAADRPLMPRDAALDRDLAEAARPRVVVAPGPQPDLAHAVADGAIVLVAPGLSRWRLDDEGLASPWGHVALTPVSLPDDTAADLADLVSSAASADTEPASWWATGDVASVTYLTPRPLSSLLVTRATEDLVTDPPHPVLSLLGPIELHGAKGERPPRAIRQCIEYAAWLLEHPGATATQMATALVIAEGTRRSNMSRLRTWLGHDDEGQPYLPDAYSGRIMLSPDVSSDWRRLRLLVGPGVNRVSPDSLAAALDLVRGAPLADAAPGQWVWAEPLRSDMVALIRDVAATLAEQALAAGDVELVRWATARGLTAAPNDELLMVLRVQAEHRAGNTVEVDRLVNRMAHHARMLGVDLAEETVVALQEVVEGQSRARRVGLS